MSYRDLGRVKTFITTTDLSAEAKQYTFVKATGAASEGLEVVATAGAGEDTVGVQWNRPAAGFAVAVGRLCSQCAASGCTGGSCARAAGAQW